MNSLSFATEGIIVSLVLLFLVWKAVMQCRVAGQRLKTERMWLVGIDKALTADKQLDTYEARVALDAWLVETPQAGESVVVFTLEHILAGSEEVETDALRRWIALPRYMAGVFVFVGLLGTVFSMSLALGKLGLTISDASSGADAAMTSQIGERLLTGITGLLSGMESAFLCTLSGILATLIVSLANWRYLHACDEFEHALQWMIVRRLSRQQNAAALNAATKSLALVSDTAFQLSAKLLDVSTQFEEDMDSLSASYERAGNVLEKVNGIPLEKYEDLSRSSEALAEVARLLKQERNFQDEGSETVQSAAARMERAIADLCGSLAGSQKASGESLSKMVTQVQNTNTALVETVRRFELALNDVTSIVEATPIRHEMAALRAALTATQRATAGGQNSELSQGRGLPSMSSNLMPIPTVVPRSQSDMPRRPLPVSPPAPTSAWQRVREWVGETAGHLKR